MRQCRNTVLTRPFEMTHPDLDQGSGALRLWEVPFVALRVSEKKIEYLVLYSLPLVLQQEPMGLPTLPRY